MRCAGLLLTGGRSTRMGRDKATIALSVPIPGVPGTLQSSQSINGSQATTLAERSAHLLEQTTEMVLEVGPGFTRLDHVSEFPPDSGPLAAFVAGASELGRRGWAGPILVVATDLPRLNRGMLDWLTTYHPGRSVVPVAGGRPQPLCARCEPVDAATAARLLAEGKRSMTALIETTSPVLPTEETWAAFAGDPLCLEDVDTPEQLAAHTDRPMLP